MKKIIIQIVHFIKGNKMNTIKNLSKNALSQFTSTLKELELINSAIQDHYIEQEQNVIKARLIQEELNSTRNANNRIIVKLKDFIN